MWRGSWNQRDRERSADVGYSASAYTSSSSKRLSRRSAVRVPDPPPAGVPDPPVAQQVVSHPAPPQEAVPLMPSKALCGLYAKCLEKQKGNDDMTPERFKDLQLGIAALRGFSQDTSALRGIDEEPSKPPHKKKNRIHGVSILVTSLNYIIGQVCRKLLEENSDDIRTLEKSF